MFTAQALICDMEAAGRNDEISRAISEIAPDLPSETGNTELCNPGSDNDEV